MTRRVDQALDFVASRLWAPARYDYFLAGTKKTPTFILLLKNRHFISWSGHICFEKDERDPNFFLEANIMARQNVKKSSKALRKKLPTDRIFSFSFHYEDNRWKKTSRNKVLGFLSYFYCLCSQITWIKVFYVRLFDIPILTYFSFLSSYFFWNQNKLKIIF